MKAAKPQFEEKSLIISGSFWKNKKNILFLAVILVISFTVYLPSLQNGFVNWDDNVYIHENPNIGNISNWESLVGNVKGIFTTSIGSSYNPLVILSFAFEKILFGLDSPKWWHLNNIILHLICVLLVFRIVLELGLNLIPAAFCALLFGIHPMRVESVAWLTERKDLLFGAFYLVALYYYIKSVRLSFRKRYLLIIHLSFILALLSKIQAVILPLSMLLVDYYFDRKLSVKLVFEKWSYFFLSLITGIAGTYILREQGVAIYKTLTFVERLLVGSFTYTVYLIKSVVPYEMVPLNPFPAFFNWMFHASIPITLFILGSTNYFYLKKEKVWVFGVLFFTFNIMFLLQVHQSFIADRFTYIPYLGLFFIYASGVNWILDKYGNFDRIICLALCIILIILGYMNFEQNKIWKNDETLWTHEIKHYPENITAYTKRSQYYRTKGRLKEAIHDFNKAIALHPFDAEMIINRGVTYAQLDMFNNALVDFSKAEQLDPTISEIYKNKSLLYYNYGNYIKAQSELEKYLALKPNDPDMWANLGGIRLLNKQYEKSLMAYNKAIQINPNNLFYYNNRLITYYEMGDVQRARKDLNFLKSRGFKNINPVYERRINQRK